MTGAPTTKRSWRDRLLVHPAAELFPLLTDDDLQALASDIDENGLRYGVTLHEDERGKQTLIDGRNRLDALELLGREVLTASGKVSSKYTGTVYCEAPGRPCPVDFVAFTASVNIRRRHLNSEQKRELIANLLKLDPAKSNSSIAASAKSTDKTVAKVRDKMESTSEIPRLDRTIGTDGKARAAKTAPKSHVPHASAYERDALVETNGLVPTGAAEDWPDAAPTVAQPPHLASRKEIATAILAVIDTFGGVSPLTVIDALYDVQQVMKLRAQAVLK